MKRLSLCVVLSLALSAGLGVVLIARGVKRPPVRYDLRGIALDAGRWSLATDINNQGDVVGVCGGFRALVDRRGRLAFLSPPSHGTHTTSFASGQINDRGDMVFDVISPDAGLEAQLPMVLWRNGKRQEVTAFGRPVFTGALGDDGRIVGVICSVTGTTGPVPTEPVVWRNGQATHLPVDLTKGVPSNLPMAVNLVIGAFDRLPVVWREGQPQRLPLLGGFPEGTTSAFNGHGQIVGSCRRPVRRGWGYDLRACLWENGTVRDLGALENFSSAVDINERGQTIGVSTRKRVRLDWRAWRTPKRIIRRETLNRAVLFEDGKALDLNRLIPRRSGWTLEKSTALNDRGQIVGTGQFRGQERGFVLTPVNSRP